MDVAALAIEGAWVLTPRQHADDRGVFLEWYQAVTLAGVLGFPLDLAQANHSVSRRGTLRGLHYADVPPGQAKYVYCPQGTVLDVVVDLRVGSPTFGGCDSVRLDDTDRRAVYLAEGLGHAFMALSDQASVTYLCSTAYDPTREHVIHPLDPALGLPWPAGIEPQLSSKDAAAPTLADAQEAGGLPTHDASLAYYARLAGAARRRSGGQ